MQSGKFDSSAQKKATLEHIKRIKKHVQKKQEIDQRRVEYKDTQSLLDFNNL
ncbi:MAG: hypothetical protein Q8P68_02885 [Candidatus Peregrinibacteria bacterium]|nr:hypothetical protein [Candidatus Peregrinibacteria bacterium]